MGTTTRAALYSRVSTDEQAERGTSLTDQHRRTNIYCDEQHWDVVEHYVDDGFSGATVDRPALQRLLAAARAASFDVVVVTDPDRLSRDLVDGLVIERELVAAGVQIVYLVQPTMSTLERQLRGVIAEEERRKIRDRMMRGIRAVARAGYWPGGPPPFGYRVERAPSDSHSRLVINDQEAATIVAIIDMFVDERRSTREIAQHLTDQGASTPGAARRLSNQGTGRWMHGRVRDILKTATGISGTWLYTIDDETIRLEIPAIISPARHDRLQARLAETSTGPGATQRRHKYLLAGRLVSPCGANMHGINRSDRDGRAYRCATNLAELGSDRCNCPRVHTGRTDALVWAATHDMLTDPKRLLALAGLADTLTQPGGAEDVAALDRKIRRIETALGSAIADLLARGTDAAAVHRATEQLESELLRFREHRDRVRSWTTARNIQADHAARLLALAESARGTLDNADHQLQRTILELLDVRVRITGTTPCDVCNGRGLVPAPRSTSGQGLGRTGSVCDACLRFKRLPIIEITGAIPDIDELTNPTSAPGTLPFRLLSGA